MREGIVIFGVIAAGAAMVMLCLCPEAKENFRKENRKALAKAIIPMIVFLVLVYYLMSHIGL